MPKSGLFGGLKLILRTLNLWTSQLERQNQLIEAQNRYLERISRYLCPEIPEAVEEPDVFYADEELEATDEFREVVKLHGGDIEAAAEAWTRGTPIP